MPTCGFLFRPEAVQHYTGTLKRMWRAQKAFDAYRGRQNESHPLTLIGGTRQAWVRVDGFAIVNDLLEQYLALAAMCEPSGAK